MLRAGVRARHRRSERGPGAPSSGAFGEVEHDPRVDAWRPPPLRAGRSSGSGGEGMTRFLPRSGARSSSAALPVRRGALRPEIAHVAHGPPGGAGNHPPGSASSGAILARCRGKDRTAEPWRPDVAPARCPMPSFGGDPVPRAGRRQLRHDGRPPASVRGEKPVIRDQRSALRGHQGGEPPPGRPP